jgi:hypothetical protein
VGCSGICLAGQETVGQESVGEHVVLRGPAVDLLVLDLKQPIALQVSDQSIDVASPAKAVEGVAVDQDARVLAVDLDEAVERARFLEAAGFS